MGSTFGETSALGRSAPVFTYSKSGPRTVQVELKFHRDMMDDINYGVSNADLKNGGSALAGETAEECALRELYEETGIRAGRAEEYTIGISEEFQCIFAEFRAVTDCDKNSVRLQPAETVSWRWVTKKELGEIRNSGQLTERSCSYIRNLLGE